MCSFLFLYSIPINGYDNYFVHSNLDECLGSFQYEWCCGQHSSTFLLVKICTHFWWAYTKSGTVASQGIHMFRFRRHGQKGFQGGCINLNIYLECVIVLIVPYSCQNVAFLLYVSFFYVWGIDCQKWDYWVKVCTWFNFNRCGQMVFQKSVQLNIFTRNIKEYSSPYISTNNKYYCSF